jgi:hypothetical protein
MLGNVPEITRRAKLMLDHIFDNDPETCELPFDLDELAPSASL